MLTPDGSETYSHDTENRLTAANSAKKLGIAP